MKTFDLKKLARSSTLAVAALVATLNLTACGSSGGSSTPTALPVPVTNTGIFGNTGIGVGYGGIGSVAGGATAVATSLSTMTYYGTPALQMGLQLYSNGSQLAGQGYLYTNVNWQECGIPAGSYQVTAVQGGAMSNSIISGLVLRATGATTFMIYLVQDFLTPETQVGPDGTTFPYALQGRMQFVAPNGQICNDQIAY